MSDNNGDGPAKAAFDKAAAALGVEPQKLALGSSGIKSVSDWAERMQSRELRKLRDVSQCSKAALIVVEEEAAALALSLHLFGPPLQPDDES